MCFKRNPGCSCCQSGYVWWGLLNRVEGPGTRFELTRARGWVEDSRESPLYHKYRPLTERTWTRVFRSDPTYSYHSHAKVYVDLAGNVWTVLPDLAGPHGLITSWTAYRTNVSEETSEDVSITLPVTEGRSAPPFLTGASADGQDVTVMVGAESNGKPWHVWRQTDGDMVWDTDLHRGLRHRPSGSYLDTLPGFMSGHPGKWAAAYNVGTASSPHSVIRGGDVTITDGVPTYSEVLADLPGYVVPFVGYRYSPIFGDIWWSYEPYIAPRFFACKTPFREISRTIAETSSDPEIGVTIPDLHVELGYGGSVVEEFNDPVESTNTLSFANVQGGTPAVDRDEFWSLQVDTSGPFRRATLPYGVPNELFWATSNGGIFEYTFPLDDPAPTHQQGHLHDVSHKGQATRFNRQPGLIGGDRPTHVLSYLSSVSSALADDGLLGSAPRGKENYHGANG